MSGGRWCGDGASFDNEQVNRAPHVSGLSGGQSDLLMVRQAHRLLRMSGLGFSPLPLILSRDSLAKARIEGPPASEWVVSCAR